MNKILIFLYLFQIYNLNIDLNGIYVINSISNQLYLSTEKNKLILSNKKKHFRLNLIKSDLYYIQLRGTKKSIGVDDNNILHIYNNINNNIRSKIFWKIIRINNTEFLIQNQFNNRFIEEKNNYLLCSHRNELYINNNISEYKNYIFKFIKLFEEANLQNNYLKTINKEQIDIIIKYIDLSDKNLKREGIKQIYKDLDNEEIKYSIRSIFQNLSWIRKIFILMPNEKVKSLKDSEEINDKIIYIKDKDLLGFDSANIHSFTFNLYKMEKLGISKNFIYIEDDFFFGKQLKKYDFFYYDEKKRKVVPYVITYFFHELNKTSVLNQYYDYQLKNIISFHPHSDEGWKFSISSTQKYFLEKYKFTLENFINTKFTHNAIPENIEDIKKIFEEIKDYKYINETLFSKERHILTLNQPQFFNLYLLNILKRKVHCVPYTYIPVELINKYELNKELFVLNTGGNHIPSKRQYKLEKKIMDIRFSKKTIFEKKTDKNKISNICINRYYMSFLKLSLILNFIKIYKIIKIYININKTK